MVKRFDKRGQEGVGMGAFLKLIVGLAAVVLIILGVYMYYQTAISPTDVDVDLVLMEQTCTNLLSSGNTFYCVGKYEAETDKFIGCKYAVDNLGLNIDFDGTAEPGCGSDNDIGKQICLKIKIEKGDDKFKADKVYVNNQTCNNFPGVA